MFFCHEFLVLFFFENALLHPLCRSLKEPHSAGRFKENSLQGIFCCWLYPKPPVEETNRILWKAGPASFMWT